MKRKITCIAVLLLTACMGLSACGKKESNAENQQNNSTVDETVEKQETNITFPERYENEINEVKFDLTVEVEKGFSQDMLYESTAQGQKANMDLAVSTFCEGKELETSRKDTLKDENGEEYDTWYGTLTDKSGLYVNKNSVTYTTPFFEDIYKSFHFQFNENAYARDRNFDFLSPEESAEKIKECVQQIGYSLDDVKYVYYSLDHETMQQQENLVYEDEEEEDTIGLDGSALVYKDAWTSADDCYYICMEQKYQGLPVYFGSNFWPEDTDENMPIQAVYSANGLERLDTALLSPLYIFTQSDKPIQLKPFEDMVDIVANKYGNILMKVNYTIKRATLYQMPQKQKDGSYIVKPAWLFEVIESGKDAENGTEFEHTLTTLIDAQTGEELNP